MFTQEKLVTQVLPTNSPPEEKRPILGGKKKNKNGRCEIETNGLAVVLGKR